MPGPAVGRELDDVAVLLEQAGQAAGQALVVLDEEQVHGAASVLIRDDGHVAGAAEADRAAAVAVPVAVPVVAVARCPPPLPPGRKPSPRAAP